MPEHDTPRLSSSGHDLTPLDDAAIERLAADLTDEERNILLRKGTERPFCGTLLDTKEPGTYACRLCELPLFSSRAKFISGTGWPSFFQPFDPDHVRCERDASHGMVRSEILCARCGSHLGHVFEDGPAPTGLRYCLNSASLRFHRDGDELPPASQPTAVATAYFAGGCFWGVEDQLQQVPGVIEAVSGYQGGSTESPTYSEVCSGTTGHAETVKVTFDPHRVSYRHLLDLFFSIHDPTQRDRQGPDVGSQYRSAVFAADADQLEQARSYVAQLASTDRFRGREIATAVEPAGPFHEAEAEHQDYYARNGGSCSV